MAPTPVVLRPDAEHADITALRDAYRKMQARSTTDNRSWVYWAAYHGFNRYDCWHHSRVGPGPGTQFAYDLFLPWHRAYLVSFDHVVREANPKAIQPWWDWTSPKSHTKGVPTAYSPAKVAGKPNPLASGTTPNMPGDRARRTRRFPGAPGDLPSMTQSRPGLHSVNWVLGLSQFVDFSSQVQNLHDFIHGWSGGINPRNPNQGGDMGVIATSAFDPLFWAHHTMIDRLWYLWQLKWGINNVPADYLNRVLSPFPYTVRDVLDIGTLGYEYAVSSVASVNASPQGRR